MTMLRPPPLLSAVIVLLLFLLPARSVLSAPTASQQQWGVMDKCTKMAIEKFPDHTAEDLAKRDTFIRQCQRNSRVPVREGLTPKQ